MTMGDTNQNKLTRADRLLLQVMKERSEKENNSKNKMSENEKAALQAFKNVQERKQENTFIQRVVENINKSDDFKKALLILMDDIEEHNALKEKGLKGDKLDASLSELVISETEAFARLERQALNSATNALKAIEEDYQEIELLQGAQREIRIREFKKDLFNKVLSTNILSLSLNKEYGIVFEKEMQKYISID